MQFKLTHLIFSNNNTIYGCFYQYNAYTRNITNDISSFTSESAAESNLEYRNLTFTNNLVALEHATDVQIGNLIDNGAYKSQDVIFNLPVSDIIDYSQVLSDINTNLTNLNTNIVNKNNQSDIVLCLENIFTQTFSNGSKNSIFKDSNANTDVEKANTNLCRLFRSLYYMFNTNVSTGTGNLNNSYNNSVFKALNSRLSVNEVDDYGQTYQRSIRFMLYGIYQCLTSSTTISNTVDNSFLKHISDKLANANDLHTISQAIDLISTAIAQTNNTLSTTNTDLGNIATNINSIQSNPLIEVNIDVPYEVKNLTKKDTEY